MSCLSAFLFLVCNCVSCVFVFGLCVSGYKKETAKMKLDGSMKMHEGKYGVSFEAYHKLADLIWGMKNDFMLAMWALVFLLFCWNLMARCGMVASIILGCMTMEGDAMGIEFAMHKGDADGERKFKRHVYANPKDPAICPFLALAVLVFCTTLFGGHADSGEPMLFGKDGGEARFNAFLSKLVVGHAAAAMRACGLGADDIGTHSFRKGVVQIACVLACSLTRLFAIRCNFCLSCCF